MKINRTKEEIENFTCDFCGKKLDEVKKRIHTLEIYLEGAINYLILNGDVDNPIIGDVENILHISFNKRPNVPTSYQNLNKAKNILKRLLEEEKNNMYWEMNGADKSSYYKVRKEAEQFLSEVEK